MQNCDEKALGYYEILYKGGYKTADILQTIAVLQKNLVKYSEAEQTLKEMVSLFPNDYRGYKQLALLYAAAEGAKAEDQRDYTNFKDNYEKALQLYQSQQDQSDPDMKELISVAQVGRSLGVHLILATQRPSGTVDENIWANSKFRLCLRVQDRQDSMDMSKMTCRRK